MIKNSDSTIQNSSPSQSDCWTTDADCKALIVELHDGSFCLLPYSHLAFGFLEPLGNSGHERLTLSFASHTVVMEGQRLQELLYALQQETLERVQAIPIRYKAAQDSERVSVFSISVEPIER